MYQGRSEQPPSLLQWCPTQPTSHHCTTGKSWRAISHSFATIRFRASTLPHIPSRQHSNSPYGEVPEHYTVFSWCQMVERKTPY